MKKNGFIATSILYSFFLVFITLFIALVLNYLHNQVLIKTIDKAAWEKVLSIKNKKLSSLEIGERIKFANKAELNCKINGDDNYVSNCYLNDDASWILAYKDNNNYYFLSDLDAQMPYVKFQLAGKDKIPTNHAISIDIVNGLKSKYQEQLMFNGIEISIPTIELINNVKVANIDEDVRSAILGEKASYVIYNGSQYYYLKRYNFSSDKQSLVPSYCGNNAYNTMIYIHSAIDNDGNKYYDYCLYANPNPYTHLSSDGVVDIDELNQKDLITYTYASTYNIRLMAKVPTDKLDNYIAAGRGTIVDPYLLRDGGKIS